MNAVNIRWMIRRDMAAVEAIEEHSFPFPWSEEDFIRCLRQRNCIGMVAETDDRVVGYMIYELHKDRLHVLNFAVHCKFLRNGVGTKMLDKLIGKLNPEHRGQITLEVMETNFDALQFFRTKGFRAVKVLSDFYEETTRDAYLMQYQHRTAQEA